jgi:hypothetical protein
MEVSGQLNSSNLRETAHSKYWTGGWVAPGAGVDAVDIRNIFAPVRNRNLIPLVNQSVA